VHGTSTITTKGMSVSGTINNLPNELEGYGYGYDWRVAYYPWKIPGQNCGLDLVQLSYIPCTTYQTVNYIVNDGTSDGSGPRPLKMPQDLQVDDSKTTSRALGITWTYPENAAGVSHFEVWRALSATNGAPNNNLSDYSLVGITPYSPTEGNYAFDDANLLGNTNYSYIIRTRRTTKEPTLSLFTLPVAGKTLARGQMLSVIQPTPGTAYEPITVPNGTAASALGLPNTVQIQTSGTTTTMRDVAVTWNVAAANYNPNLAAEQTFAVQGTFTLPDDVDSGGLSTVVTAWVKVLAAATHIVILDKQEGTGGATSVQVQNGAQMPAATAPTRSGYDFAGYFDAISGGTMYYTPTMASARTWNKGADGTLYAHWTPTAAAVTTVTFNATGGSGGTTSIPVTFGSPMPTVTLPTRSGYEFAGYFDAQNGGTQYYTATGASARNWDQSVLNVLYAQWTPRSGTVTLNANGGLGGTTSIPVTFGQPINNVEPPTRTGYAFGGYWDAAGSKQYYSSAGFALVTAWDVANVNETLFAKWTPQTYTVFFDINGGAGAPDPVETVATFGLGLPAVAIPVHTDSDLAFTGYYSARVGGTQYYTATGASARNWDIAQDRTLHAQWGTVVATDVVTLNNNGGENGTSSVAAIDGEAMPAAQMPHRDGYTFDGYWDATFATEYYDSVGNSVHDWSVGELSGQVPANTLFAKWTPNQYVLTLDGNGGPDGWVDATFDATLPSVPVPTRAGYDFLGYFDTDASDGGTQWYLADGTSAATLTQAFDTTLYARWTAQSYTVTLDDGDGSGGDGFFTVELGGALPDVTSPTTDTGTVFIGYFDQDGKQYFNAAGKALRVWDVAADATLSARYSADTYLVSLDANYGNVGTIEVLLVALGQGPKADVPQRMGYAFAGYFDTDATSGGTQYLDESGEPTNAWAQKAPDTLYARWTANEYTLTFEPNGGTGGSTSVSVTFGEPIPSATMPTRDGFTFAGYFDLNAQSEGIEFYDADGLPNGLWTIAADQTAYARWTANSYSITLDQNYPDAGTAATVPATFGTAPDNVTKPVRESYTFLGYYDQSSETGGVQYFDAEGRAVRVWDKDGDATLYGRWIVTEVGKFPVSVSNGIITVGSGYAAAGDSITVAAAAPPQGKVFDEWELDGPEGWTPPSDLASNPITFVMPNGSVSLRATFRNADGASHSVIVYNGIGQGMYAVGAPAMATATPPEGMVFDHWQFTGPEGWGTPNAFDNPVFFNMPDGDVTLTATFMDPAQTRHWLDAYSADGGGAYTAGDLVTLTARVPEPGEDEEPLVFDHWEISGPAEFIAQFTDAALAVNPLVFEMPAGEVSVTAVFREAGPVDPTPTTTTPVPTTTTPVPTTTTPVPTTTTPLPTIPTTSVPTTTTPTSTTTSPTTTTTSPTTTTPVPTIPTTTTPTSTTTSPTTTTTRPTTTTTSPTTTTTSPTSTTSAPTAGYVVTVGNGSGGAKYAVGTTVTITAGTAPSGKVFDKWTSSDGVIFADATKATTTFTMPNKAVTVTATFKDAVDSPPSITKYAVTVEGGSGGGQYAVGATVTITANTVSGKVFGKWTSSDGVTFADANKVTTTFTMPAKPVKVTATYEVAATTSTTKCQWNSALLATDRNCVNPSSSPSSSSSPTGSSASSAKPTTGGTQSSSSGTQYGSSGSQYTTGGTQYTSNGTKSTVGSQSTGSTLYDTSGGTRSGAQQIVSAAPVVTSSPTKSETPVGKLFYTGAAIWPTLIATCLLVGGLAYRRRTRRATM